MDDPRYTRRTVEWGHWGITFMDIQPDRSKNFGSIAGYVSFPVGTRGPCDAGDLRPKFQNMCAAWIATREIPEGFVPRA